MTIWIMRGMAFTVTVRDQPGCETIRVMKPQYSTEPPSENFWYPPTQQGKKDLEHALALMQQEAQLLGLERLITPTNVYLIESPLGDASSRRGRKRGRYASGKDVLVMEQPYIQKIAIADVPSSESERVEKEYFSVLEFITNLYNKHGILMDGFGRGNLELAQTDTGIHWVLLDTAPVPPEAGPGTALLIATLMAWRTAKARVEFYRQRSRKGKKI